MRVVVFQVNDQALPWGARCLEVDLSGYGRTPELAESDCARRLIKLVNDGVKQKKVNPLADLERAPAGFWRLLNPHNCYRAGIDTDWHQPRWAEVHQQSGAVVNLVKGYIEIPTLWDGIAHKPIEKVRYDLATGRQLYPP